MENNLDKKNYDLWWWADEWLIILDEVDVVTSEQKRKMLHALGVSYSKSGKQVEPYKRYRPKLRAYRNHYNGEDQDWELLCKLGYAKKFEKFGQVNYLVTKKGIILLKGLGYIFEEED